MQGHPRQNIQLIFGAGQNGNGNGNPNLALVTVC
jgi:hypothetical protein